MPQSLQVGGLDTDAHILVNESGGVGAGGGGVEVGVRVVGGIVSLEQNVQVSFSSFHLEG